MATRRILNDVLCVCSNLSVGTCVLLLETSWEKQCRHVHTGKYPMIPYTNLSLWATAAICLYHAGVDKQMAMKRTGHHSVESIWTYKQTTEQQCAATLDTSISNHKKPCLESSDHTEVQVAHTNHSLSVNDTYWYLRLVLSLSTSVHAVLYILILTAINRVLLITVPLQCIVYTIYNFIQTNWKIPER